MQVAELQEELDRLTKEKSECERQVVELKDQLQVVRAAFVDACCRV
jgi:cell division protein FtsB